MADWFAIYQTSDGTLVSLATVVADPLPAGLTKKVIAERPVGFQWNTTLLDWEPAPAPPPDADRVGEFLTRVGSSLKGNAKTKVRDELTILLGDSRFRDPSDSYEVKVP